MVEHRLPKPVVAGSIPVSRSRFLARISARSLTVHTVQKAVEDDYGMLTIPLYADEGKTCKAVPVKEQRGTGFASAT